MEWDEDSLTWDDFGTPAIEQEGDLVLVTLQDNNDWLDIEITGFIDGAKPPEELSLVLKNISTGVGNSRISFASREICHSPKLVIVTELI